MSNLTDLSEATNQLYAARVHAAGADAANAQTLSDRGPDTNRNRHLEMANLHAAIAQAEALMVIAQCLKEFVRLNTKI